MFWCFLCFSDVSVAKKEAKSLLWFGGFCAFLTYNRRKNGAKVLLCFGVFHDNS